MSARIIIFALLVAVAMPVFAGTTVDEPGKLLAEGDFDGALELLADVPAEEQDSPFHLLLAQANLAKLQTVSFMEKGPFARAALDHLEKSIEIDPSNVEARTTLYGYYLNAPPIAGGSIDLAQEQAQEIVKYDADRGNALLAETHWRKGKALEDGGDVDGARAEYEKALALNPDSEQYQASLEALDAK